MLPSIVRSSIRLRLLVLAAAAALLIVGVTQLPKAPVDTLPEFTAPVVRIQTESLGLSANEVEELITVPMEQDLLNGVRGARVIGSHSVPGLSSVDLVFDQGTSMLEARQLVQERLTQAHALPNVSKPPQMLDPVSSTGHVMIIGLSTKKLSPIQLSVLARWTIRPRLLGLSGVANVAIWGHRDRQLQVLVDPARLRARGLTVSQVVRTTGNAQLVSPLSFLEASTPGTGGFIDGAIQRLSVRHVLPFGTPRDLAQVPVEGTSGKRHTRLGDVAKVVQGHPPLIGDAVVHGGPGLLLVVDKVPGADTRAVTQRVDEALAELKQGMPGVSVDQSIFRPATYVESAIENLILLLLLGGALAVIALTAFLRRWSAVLVSVVAVTLSVTAALLVLRLLGETINMLALAGLAIALGVVVDDAVGDSQSIARRVAQQRAAGGTARLRAVLEGSLEVRGPLGYATLVLLLIAVPVLVAHGLTASFVHPMALAFGLAVLASMVVALTVTPALSVMLAARAQRRARPSALGGRLADAYGRLLGRGFRAPAVALLVLCAIGLGGLALVPWLMQPNAPSFKDRDLLVRLKAAPGISLIEMNRITQRTSAQLSSVPGVRNVGANVGRAVTGDQPVGTNSGEIWVSMDEGADYDGTKAAVRDAVRRTPGLGASVTTYEADRSTGVLTRADDAVDVRLYGQDYDVLDQQAARLAQSLSGIEGVRDPQVEHPVKQSTVRIEVKLAAAFRQGIKPGDVRRAAATLLSGITVGAFFEDQKVFEVVVRGIPATYGSVESVRKLVIDKPGGGHVRLREVANVTIDRDPVDIRHDAVSRFVDIHMQVSGRGVGAVQSDIRRQLRQYPLPLEYSAEVQGSNAEPHTSRGGFMAFVIAAVVGMFLLLQAAFGSWRLASLMLLFLPTALLGGVVVVLATGNEHSLGAAAGLVAVLAIAVRQGVVTLRHLQRPESEDAAIDSSLVLRRMRERLAATGTSAVTIGAALLPFVLLGDVAGNEITNPLAAVVLGGLVTTTLLTLFVIPAAYLRFALATAAGADGRRMTLRPIRRGRHAIH
jgi:Cu/Ag efflux pump CusA